MMKTLKNRFTSSEQKEKTNIKEVKLLEERSAKKLIDLIKEPFEKLSQRERAKAARLKEKLNVDGQSTVGELLLIIAISPLYHLNVEKMRYSYFPKPKVKQNMREQDIKMGLLECIKQMQEMVGLTDKFRNLFNSQGTKIHTLYELVEGETTFFLSSTSRFSGIKASQNLNSVGACAFFSRVSRT